MSAVMALVCSAGARAADTMDTAYWNLPKGVTKISQEVWVLHMVVFWVCIAIGVVVFGVMFYSLWAHRRSRHPTPANFHESTTIEILWTIVPFVILVGLAVPAAGTLIRQYDTRNSDLAVKITGYQWKWQYEYVGENYSFFSTLDAKSNIARQLKSGIDPNTVPNYLHEVDNYLVLPVGKKVHFLLTANDVIHGWWVPDIAVKKDAIPGYINEMWATIDEAGVYRGQCTVLCGRDHGFMPIVVKAVPEAEFKAWLAKQKGTQLASAGPTPVEAPTSPVAAAPTDTGNTAAAPVAAAAGAPVAAAGAAPAPAPAPTQVAAAEAVKPAAPAKLSKDDLVKAGEKIYQANCQVCHQANGQGMAPTFPSLIKSKVVAGPAEEQVTQILKGKNAMPPFPQLSDNDIAAVATYERNSWGNANGEVQPSQVTALRGK